MKRFFIGMLAVGLLVLEIPAAEAAVCAVGVVRAGCVGRHGAVVTTRPVVRHHRCVWVNGRCR